MKKLLLLSMFVAASCMTQAQQTEHITVLETATFKDSIVQKKVQLVDVRTPEEYNAGHIDDAVNIDFFSEDFAEDFDKLDKDQPIYIYCKSGNRSGKAAKKLSEMGFETIYDLKGGFSNYK